MDKTPGSGDGNFTAFRSAAEEAAMKREGEAWENEGGHMSSRSGCVRHVSGAELPFVAVLTHHGTEASEHAFATMREAEAFIKRNTPVPGRTLSELYDRPASEIWSNSRSDSTGE
jgi:hypothetical protein